MQQQQQAEMMKGAASGVGKSIVDGAINNPEGAENAMSAVQGAMQQ